MVATHLHYLNGEGLGVGLVTTKLYNSFIAKH